MNARTCAVAASTAVAGSLDITSAIILGSFAGRSPTQTLQGVASGPFGKWAVHHQSGALLGLATHFALMAVMALVFVIAAGRFRLSRRPLLAGAGYGLIIYVVMYWIVLPLRWPTLFPDVSAKGIITALAIHVLLVGIPIALICRRFLGEQPD